MAVYTQLTNEQIAAFIETDYDVGMLDFSVGITQGVENTNYLIATRANGTGPEQKYILTLYEKRMDPRELPFFLDLMHHLADHGISCPQPIVRRDGQLIGEVLGKPAALVSFIHGKSRTIFKNAHAASVGGALARLHVAGQEFAGTRTNALSLAGWTQLYAAMEGQLDTIQHGLEQLVCEELDYLKQQMPSLQGLPQGVIHADLFPDNVFFEGDDVSGVIDFYFACNDALVYDVAITLNAWCFETKGEFNPIKSKLLLTHYQEIRPFSELEKAALQLLLRGAALRFLLTRAYDWLNQSAGAQVIPKNPLEYASKLRFHQHVKDVREYGC